jgi:thiamine monophosphate kinase
MTSIQEADDLETDIDLEEKRPTNLLFSATGRQSGKQKVVQSTAQGGERMADGGTQGSPRTATQALLDVE